MVSRSAAAPICGLTRFRTFDRKCTQIQDQCRSTATSPLAKAACSRPTFLLRRGLRLRCCAPPHHHRSGSDQAYTGPSCARVRRLLVWHQHGRGTRYYCRPGLRDRSKFRRHRRSATLFGGRRQSGACCVPGWFSRRRRGSRPNGKKTSLISRMALILQPLVRLVRAVRRRVYPGVEGRTCTSSHLYCRGARRHRLRGTSRGYSEGEGIVGFRSRMGKAFLSSILHQCDLPGSLG